MNVNQVAPRESSEHSDVLRNSVTRRRSDGVTTDGVSWENAVLPASSLPDAIQQLRSVDAAGLTFVLRGSINRHDCSALWDSGAGLSFISSAFIKRFSIPVKNKVQNIALANGAFASSNGLATVRVQLLGSGSANYDAFLNLAVMELTDGIDCILGDQWSRKEGIIADYGREDTAVFSPANLWIRSQSVRIMPDASLYSQRTTLFHTEGETSWLFAVSENSNLASTEHCDADQHLHSRLKLEQSITDVPTEQLASLLKRYQRVFDPPGLNALRNVTPECIILQPGSRPPNRPPFRQSLAERAETEKQVNELLASGRVVPSHSPYGAPVLHVPKRGSTAVRMCIDYRALNQLTIRNKYPMPRIDDLLDNLSGACFFSSLDLTSGYWQITLHPKDWEKTAFNTHMGKFEWRVMPFGLTNAPAVFQAVMHHLFSKYLNKFVLIYLDDILIFSRTKEEHMKHLALVLGTLDEECLKANLKKCDFFKTELRFLGHVVTRDGLKADPDKVSTVNDWPTPKSVYEVRSFLGLATYFRRYIQDFAKIATPLTNLLKGLTADDKKGKLMQRGKLPAEQVASIEKAFSNRWTSDCQKAFEQLKNALTSAPVLKLPDFEKPFVLECDASEDAKAVGGILLQDGRPVAYTSKKLSGPELNYSVSDMEMLAAIYALREFRPYLEGKPFTIVTDHQPNTYLDKSNNSHTLKRRARWLYESAGYDYQWQYKPGKRNIADPLSRAPQHFACMCTVIPAGPYKGRGVHMGAVATGVHRGFLVSTALPTKGKRKRKRKASQLVPEVSDDALIGRFVVESFLTRVRKGLDGMSKLSAKELDARGYKRDADGLIWTKQDLLYVPNVESLREDCISAVHAHPTSGHYGLRRTLEKVREVFFWEGQKADVQRFLRTCDSCQRCKAPRMKPQGELHPLNIPFRRWQSIAMDLITDLPVTQNGFDSIVVFVDRLSKMVHLAACTKTVTADQLGDLMEQHVFRLHGLPQDIVSDRDIRFNSSFWQESCEDLQIKMSRSTGQHPQSDGQTERANGILEDTLRHFVSPYQQDWDKLLAVAEFAMNNAYNESIKTTPFMLNYGQSPDTPVIAALRRKNPNVNKFVGRWSEQLKEARDCLEAAQQRQKYHADKKRRPAEELAVGDYVLISMKHFELVPGLKLKLAPRFIGPVPITAVIGPKHLAYRVELPPPLHRKHNVFHVSSLKKYHVKGAVPPPSLPHVSEDAAGWSVDYITDTTGTGRDRKYFVHWLGGGESWEPAYRLVYADKEIASFWKSKGQTPPIDAYVTLQQLAELLEGKQSSKGE
jgi:RNase H-like domain found in reverse transcriptase/Reverse transcriptase (RNA-dependent DNA polymerase)/Integrase zinc binding domain